MSSRAFQRDELVHQYALHSDEIANLSESCIDEVQVFLSAIVELSKAYPVIHDLAKIGVELAEERAQLVLRANTTGKERIAAYCAIAGGPNA